MLIANIITEKRYRAKDKAKQISKRPCSSEVTQDTEFPLPSDIMAFGRLHAQDSHSMLVI